MDYPDKINMLDAAEAVILTERRVISLEKRLDAARDAARGAVNSFNSLCERMTVRNSPHKVNAIKGYRDRHEVGLKEAKDEIDQVVKDLGV